MKAGGYEMNFGERMKKINKQFGEADEYRGALIGSIRNTTKTMLGCDLSDD